MCIFSFTQLMSLFISDIAALMAFLNTSLNASSTPSIAEVHFSFVNHGSTFSRNHFTMPKVFHHSTTASHFSPMPSFMPSPASAHFSLVNHGWTFSSNHLAIPVFSHHSLKLFHSSRRLSKLRVAPSVLRRICFSFSGLRFFHHSTVLSQSPVEFFWLIAVSTRRVFHWSAFVFSHQFIRFFVSSSFVSKDTVPPNCILSCLPSLSISIFSLDCPRPLFMP